MTDDKKLANNLQPHRHGEVKRIWVEIFDAEMGVFIFSPIDVLDCASCPRRPQEVADEQ